MCAGCVSLSCYGHCGAAFGLTTRRAWGSHRRSPRARSGGFARFRQFLKIGYGRKRQQLCGGRELGSASYLTELTLNWRLCIPVRQRAQLSPPPVSSLGSKRRDRPTVTGPGLPQRDSWPGGWLVKVTWNLCKGGKEYEITKSEDECS